MLESTIPLPHVTGTRVELVAELHRLAAGWEHLGKDKLSAACWNGVGRIEAGDSSIRVGHTLFVVTDA